MYPYDFVRLSGNVTRMPYQPHDHFTGLAGRLEGTITTLTPFFLPETDPKKARTPYKPFLTNGAGQAIIPGSSLKGLIRSLVETLGPGCWWLFDGNYDEAAYKEKLPPAFRQCPDARGNLCVACRMFGLIKGNTLLLGHVGFEDAVCQQRVDYAPLYTIILGSPKPRHDAFYLTPDKKQVAGRKFYYHSAGLPVDRKQWLPDGAPRTKPAQNAYIKPLDKDSVFNFSAHFDNLAAEELALLLYALVLEPEMRHKLGYAKPAGLGSVEIRLTGVELLDYAARYTMPGGGKTRYEGDSLQQYLTRQIAPFVSNTTSITLQDLRRIWAWPGRKDLRFPDFGWFHAAGNSTKRLSETP